MTDQPRTRVFISYSRNDADFVDKLEVGLKSRGFDTWVDRRKLEAGTSWQRELQRAIENSQAMALVLSPDSIASPNVEGEYLHAFDRGLVVIPILYKTIDPAAFPMELKRIQWIDFRDQRQYDASLTNLVNVLALLARPAPASPAAAVPVTTPALSPESVTATPHEPASPPQQPSMPTSPLSLKDLYDRGDAAYRRGDLERAAIFFQQILLVNRDYLNGEVAKTMALLQKQIQTKRVDYLRADAAQAHDAGDWGREITDWQAVVQLEPNDRAAQEQLAHAKVNLDYVDAYAIVNDRLQRHELDLARQMLKGLWEKAPLLRRSRTPCAQTGHDRTADLRHRSDQPKPTALHD